MNRATRIFDTRFAIAGGICAAALTGAAASAQEQKGTGLYGSASVTLSTLEDNVGTITSPPPFPPIIIENSFETGFGAQLALGYDFGDFRLEGEVGFTGNDQSSYVAVSPPTGRIPGDIEQNSLRAMVNVYIDLTDGPVQPYLGAGIGLATVDLTFIAPRAPFPTEAPQTLIDDSDGRFAYQLIGGASVQIGPKAELFAQYRWFDAGSVTFADARGSPVTASHSGHNFDAGIRFRF